jgi:hypothetical protein
MSVTLRVRQMAQPWEWRLARWSVQLMAQHLEPQTAMLSGIQLARPKAQRLVQPKVLPWVQGLGPPKAKHSERRLVQPLVSQLASSWGLPKAQRSALLLDLPLAKKWAQPWALRSVWPWAQLTEQHSGSLSARQREQR